MGKSEVACTQASVCIACLFLVRFHAYNSLIIFLILLTCISFIVGLIKLAPPKEVLMISIIIITGYLNIYNFIYWFYNYLCVVTDSNPFVFRRNLWNTGDKRDN